MCVLIIAFALLALFAIYQKNTNRVCKSRKKLNGKTCVVTGGTSGMGLEIAKDFARRGTKVIIACPFEEEGISAQNLIRKETGNDQVFFKHLDLASLASTRRFAEEILEEKRLDLLINNAGSGISKIITQDGLNLTMQINYFGHFLLTILLLPLLKKTGKSKDKSKIINTTSMLHHFGVPHVKDVIESYGKEYNNSKTCLVLFSYELAKRLKGQNVVVNSVDPGIVGTAIYSSSFGKIIGSMMEYFYKVIMKTPWEGCQTALYVALDEELGDVSGEYFRNCRLGRARALCYDDKIADELWNESVRLVKLEESEVSKSLRP